MEATCSRKGLSYVHFCAFFFQRLLYYILALAFEGSVINEKLILYRTADAIRATVYDNTIKLFSSWYRDVSACPFNVKSYQTRLRANFAPWFISFVEDTQGRDIRFNNSHGYWRSMHCKKRVKNVHRFFASPELPRKWLSKKRVNSLSLSLSRLPQLSEKKVKWRQNRVHVFLYGVILIRVFKKTSWLSLSLSCPTTIWSV